MSEPEPRPARQDPLVTVATAAFGLAVDLVAARRELEKAREAERAIALAAEAIAKLVGHDADGDRDLVASVQRVVVERDHLLGLREHVLLRRAKEAGPRPDLKIDALGAGGGG